MSFIKFRGFSQPSSVKKARHLACRLYKLGILRGSVHKGQGVPCFPAPQIPSLKKSGRPVVIRSTCEGEPGGIRSCRKWRMRFPRLLSKGVTTVIFQVQPYLFAGNDRIVRSFVSIHRGNTSRKNFDVLLGFDFARAFSNNFSAIGLRHTFAVQRNTISFSFLRSFLALLLRPMDSFHFFLSFVEKARLNRSGS